MNSKVKVKPAVWIKIIVFATVCTLVLSGCGAKFDDSNLPYIEEYIAFAEEFQDKNISRENEYSKLGYELIYLDNDDIPEIVMGLDGHFVSLFTYADGEIVTVMDEWGYGAGGNPGYEYIEKSGIVSNISSGLAGAHIYYTYWKWDSKNRELPQMYDDFLYVSYLNDLDGDGEFDYTSDDESILSEPPVYYYGESQISEEEFKSYFIEGEYKSIKGNLSLDELIDKLNFIKK